MIGNALVAEKTCIAGPVFFFFSARRHHPCCQPSSASRWLNSAKLCQPCPARESVGCRRGLGPLITSESPSFSCLGGTVGAHPAVLVTPCVRQRPDVATLSFVVVVVVAAVAVAVAAAAERRSTSSWPLPPGHASHE
ncbi:hypothetical protein BS50DRAFT_569496 [Corynespora cassiicola Philippines]|uniref:Uncharacterized protein n=1 Tax=Corynespora cassiicola Philippines TaxID=1448308 RepID=A0A2T2P2I7_CORCC|nr:hypothetical protein BS50DRAFT_569496 [Corynespora cassiicola Philippines]